MRIPPETISTKEKIEEFDSWLTPQLHDIKGTDRFDSELNGICSVIDHLSFKLDNFKSVDACAIDRIRDSVVSICIEKARACSQGVPASENLVSEFLSNFFALLFLVTGATDNNLKNHFFIKLRQDGVLPAFPEKIGRANVTFRLKPFGNTITSKNVSTKLARALIASLDGNLSAKTITDSNIDLRQHVNTLCYEYISLILSDRHDVIQFWAMCNSYVSHKRISDELAMSFMTPSIIFKVRGSVSASGGHLPEKILKEKLTLLGLESGVDFNTSDVVVGEEEFVEAGQVKKKTRAYDFVLPYNRDGWTQKIFIQSQFYAGDSGSVSHKVVDQTVSSRTFTKRRYPDARFVEYLDGAGYFASLRTDLLHMMKMADTHSFIQVRSLWIRLRRELQQIGFITPVEIEHAIMRTKSGSVEEVKEILLKENYLPEEVERSISYAITNNIIFLNIEKLSICSERLDLARRLFIIDIIAINGEVVLSAEDHNKCIFIPGYGHSFGIRAVALAQHVDQMIKLAKVSTPEYMQDMEWLIEEKVIKKIM